MPAPENKKYKTPERCILESQALRQVGDRGRLQEKTPHSLGAPRFPALGVETPAGTALTGCATLGHPARFPHQPNGLRGMPAQCCGELRSLDGPYKHVF